MVIGIIGTRSRDSLEDQQDVFEALTDLLNRHEKPSHIGFGYSLVSGGCPKGGDRFAEVWATAIGMPTFRCLPEGAGPADGHMNIHPALWDQYGRSAGYRRNIYIARDADWLIACVAANRKGGTEDTIKKFLTKGQEFKERLILV